MATRWFKMPVGTSQNQVLALTAKKIGASRALVLGVYTVAIELAAEDNRKARNRKELSEIVAFTLGEPENDVENILGQLEGRGFIDADGAPVGLTEASSDAERAKKYRERKKSVTNASRDENERVPNASRLERPERPEREKDQSVTVTPVTVDNSGAGSFKKIGSVVVGGSDGFDIREHLSDHDTRELYQRYAAILGWDIGELYRKYNAYVSKNPPRSPGFNSFDAWAQKFTKGRRA